MRRLNRALRRRPPPRWLWPAVTVATLALPTAAAGYGLGAAIGTGRAAALWAGAADGLVGLSAGMGLRVAAVYAEGLGRTGRDELAASAAIAPGQPLLAVDPEGVRARVERLTWVRSAAVTRTWPDTIEIRLVERRPLALWRRTEGFELVDGGGEVIPVEDIGPFRDLPVIVGEEAPSRAALLFAAASGAPGLLGRIRVARLVGGRRWDVRLHNGVRVRLPEHGAETALRLLAGELRRLRLLEPPTQVVDLRLPDRLVLRRRLDGDGREQADRPRLRSREEEERA